MRRHHREATESPRLADPEWFTREILPGIQTISIRQLAAATDLSLRYCALIRNGERIPQPRHWSAFSAAGEPAGG